MRRLSPILGNIGTIVLIAAPIALAVVLNQTLRPYLAQMLGGVEHESAAWVRGSYTTSNRWWEFDARTQAEHPLLTAYLQQWDGAYIAIGGLCALLITVIVLFRAARGGRRPVSTTKPATPID